MHCLHLIALAGLLEWLTIAPDKLESLPLALTAEGFAQGQGHTLALYLFPIAAAVGVIHAHIDVTDLENKRRY